MKELAETWRKATAALLRLSDNDTVQMREQIVETALATGLFFIWQSVFEGDADMQMRLRVAFEGR